MKFTTYIVADICTHHITQRDAELLADGVSGLRIGEIDGGRGFLVMVPDGEEDEAEWAGQLREDGYSEAYIDVLREAAKQDIPYIRFDADGCDIENAPVFDW